MSDAPLGMRAESEARAVSEDEGPRGSARPVQAALAAFVAIFAAWVALLLASAVLFADLDVLMDPAHPDRLHPALRFHATLALVLSYTAAAAMLGGRWMERDFEALRPVIDMEEREWAQWRRRVHHPDRRRLLLGAVLGALAGLAVSAIGTSLAERYEAPGWVGFLVWNWALNLVLFCAMGFLAGLSSDGSRIFVELGRRARVSLVDRSPLAPFARTGFELAVLWLLGSSLACLLFLSSSAHGVVAAVLVVTVAIAVASLLAPSRGVHARLCEAKAAELAWVRAELARAREALAGADVQTAARLPALLAWERRVQEASEWPFDTPTLIRFALFALVPIGSWLGGALVERVLNQALG
jgi:hypothetical protein